ncbi:hypothetical protein acsn021_23310 [Anaerocolumna cellulosilytica]|uniref:Uncharacterized protein n=1 Tax=Anaerocolumna cellulosilytica TaxID=433286 RepID=A0A6S6R5P9_9FIRM|nr:hypothetical protein [Anaerocolumna cellulosilytica]MBB5194024.1 putative membrane protein YeaQ/YmgE (transglycosylase-associated protein family) [Anaerocolumna cellulosilytica]BCJ94762.1 hypothetical protein acsn021_23310 [Anaerocolumna cellulosilytica]
MKDRKAISVITGISIMIIIYILLYVGIVVLLKQKINSTNLLAYFIFSLIVGVIAGLYIFFKLMPAFYCFIAGIIIGFYEMYRMFLNGMDGWADLTGFISMIVYIIFGFAIGIVAQLIRFFYNKSSQKRGIR